MPTETFANLPPDKRTRVLDAALHEFSESGYELASISRMVARAGIAKGSFYQYFESKLDLFEHLLVEELGRQKLAFVKSQPPPPPGSDFFASLEVMVYGGVRWALDQPRLARITETMLSPSSDPDLRVLADRMRKVTQEAMSTLLRSGQEAGQVRRDLHLDVASAVLTATLQQGLDRALWQRFGLDLVALMRDPEQGRHLSDAQLRELVAEVVDLLRHALGLPGGHWDPEQLDVDRITELWRSRR